MYALAQGVAQGEAAQSGLLLRYALSGLRPNLSATFGFNPGVLSYITFSPFTEH